MPEKAIKVSLVGDEKKLLTSLKSSTEGMKTYLRSIRSEFSEMNSNWETSLNKIRMSLDALPLRLTRIKTAQEETTTAIQQGFLSVNKVLVSNNDTIEKLLKNMVALQQQNNQIKQSATEVGKATADAFDSNKMAGAFIQYKLMNQAWNTIINSIFRAKDELIEFDKITRTISNMSGESLSGIQTKIFNLAQSSGRSIGEIAKAVQDATNEGNNLSASFDKISVAIVLANKNMGNLSNTIARVDDIVDQFGVSADRALGLVMGKNLSSERALAVFGRLARDAKEAGFEVENYSSVLNVMANRAGIAERSLQIGFRAVLNGLQEVGAEGQKVFFEQIMPNWNLMTDAQKRYVEGQFRLRENDEFLRVMGERWGEILRDVKEYNTNESSIISRAKEQPDSLALQLNKTWALTLQYISQVGEKMSQFVNANAFFKQLNYQLQQAVGSEDPAFLRKRASDLADTIAELKRLKFDSSAYSDKQKDLDLINSKLLKENTKIDPTFVGLEQFKAQALQKVDIMKQAFGSVSWNNIAGGAIFDQREIVRLEEATKFYQKERDSRMRILEASVLEKQADADKVAALKLKLDLLFKEGETIRQNIKYEAEHHASDTRFQAESKKQLEENAISIQRTKEQLKDAERARAKEIAREEEADRKKHDEVIINTFKQKQSELDAQFKLGKITGDQYVFELKMHQGILNSLINKSSLNKLIAQDNEKIAGIYVRNKKIKEETLQKVEQQRLSMDILFQKELSQSQMLDVMAKRKSFAISEEEQLRFRMQQVKEEIDRINSTNEQRYNETTVQGIVSVARIEIETRLNTIATLAAAGKDALAKEEQAALDSYDKRLKADIDATQAAYKNWIDTNAAKQAAYERTHFTIKDMDQILAQNLENGFGRVVDKLVFNTGKLSDIWKDFVKNLLRDMANKLIKDVVMSFIMPEKGAGLLERGFKWLFSSEGTTLSGVPGYAFGSGLRGVDSVPAMLSPGEIVLDNNASDLFRGMVSRGGGMGGITVIVQSYPSLLGSREELIRLDTALNNPTIRTAIDRRKI